MADTTTPADRLLDEAVTFLLAKQVDVVADVRNGAWVYVVDGVVMPTGDVVFKAIALGMMEHGTVQ